MPRKTTIQPAPLETFVLDDGTVIEVRDRETREIGRGLDKKFNAEELDWQVYESFGLVEPDDGVSMPEGEGMDLVYDLGLELGQRAFEVVLARKMAAGEVQTTWFERHNSTPITELPRHWPDPVRAR